MISDTRITLDAAERQALKEAALRRGLRHKDIAASIGVDYRQFAKYACGERRPTAEVLDAWRRVLGIRPRRGN